MECPGLLDHIKHINKGNIQWDKCDHITNERYEESLEIALMSGDIVFSKDGSIGNPALIRNLPGKATINSTMMLVRPHEFLYPEYFYQIMDSIYFKRLIRERLSGTAIPHIFQEDMKKFKFPLPSIEEQKFIAGILEALDHQVKSIELQISCSKSLQKSLINQIF
ncbi:MAG: restriction endonuclease subunit S [Burkholderiales bacterium]|nr:restriction endonuclease subunit S [Burkholderiales bacterium]